MTDGNKVKVMDDARNAKESMPQNPNKETHTITIRAHSDSDQRKNDTKCTICTGIDGDIEEVPPDVADMLRGHHATIKTFFDGFDSIWAHPDCLDSMLRGTPDEGSLDAYEIASKGTDEQRIALINQMPEMVIIGEGTPFSIAYALAKNGSTKVRTRLMDMWDHETLKLGAGTEYSVARALAWYGSYEAMLRLMGIGGKNMLRIGNGTEWSVAYALARKGSDAVHRKLMRLGMDVMLMRGMHGQTVAYAIAAFGSEESGIELVNAFGMDALKIDANTDWSVAYALVDWKDGWVEIKWSTQLMKKLIRVGGTELLKMRGYAEQSVASVFAFLCDYDDLDMLILDTCGRDALFVESGTDDSIGWNMAKDTGSDDVRIKMIELGGIDVLKLTDSSGVSVAHLLGFDGGKDVCAKLEEFGEEVLDIRINNDGPTVRDAIAEGRKHNQVQAQNA